MITDMNPDTIEAIAPASEYPRQNRLRMMTGQKVAAIPDQPKMITQNTCRSGDNTAIAIAILSAITAMMTVTTLESLVS